MTEIDFGGVSAQGYEVRIAETAEAICGALHRYSYDFTGETDGGASTWFHRGEQPKDIRVEVVRSKLAPMVLVNLEGRNLNYRPPMRVRITIQCDVRGSKADVFRASEQAVLRCLTFFKEVLEGDGSFAPGAAERKTVESTADSAVPDTDDDERDAGLRDADG